MARLHVHTAESLVIITASPEALAGLQAGLSGSLERTAVRLRSGTARPVTIFSGTTSPTLDPDEGWLIALPPQARDFLLSLAPGQTGAWELPGINVGFVLE
ncbi:hypothetical protein H7347_09790 [Corynebacterium sp. zg-331]|uniref:hypothetical protein n=1 Tax=unclassified Corynebacterium TaxID=2624378 RepID=UPI00128B324B|nr:MULTISPECIES: hypothetical protein [unclassified Corynebacterium]MBC3186851.1 hypothetical protein [Corynebacterium sp. zg-331]MPV53331.1 hypothetical protein [Corynebacterium sp. zg331]